MKMNPYIYTMNFLAEVDEPNPFVFCLMLCNQFKGELLWCEGEYLAKIDGKYYGVEGEFDKEELVLEEWALLDKLSILESVDSYESVKWFFVNPQNDDEEMFVTYGLN